jgi:small-conductance mechanosensitive channel
VNGWGVSLGLLLLGVVAGLTSRSFVFRRLKALAGRTHTRLDDHLLEATRGLWLATTVLASLVPAARFAPLGGDQRSSIANFALGGLLVVLTLVASRLVGLWLARAETGGQAASPALRPSLVQKVAQAIVLIAGTLLVLDNAGVHIETLLTALGIGSLAVALALQPTLSNLFAGIHLSLAKPIRVGDFIELEDGVQGYVADIGWRATRIRQLANSLVTVPNARLSDMRLINYTLPDPPQAVLLNVGVAYGSDLRHVESVVVDVARSMQKAVPGAEPEHEPFIRYNTFNSSSIDFTVILRAKTYTDRWLLIHEFMIALSERFRREDIEIPFPQRVVHFPEGGNVERGSAAAT